MGLMPARRLLLAALVSLCSLAGVALGLASPALAESCPNALSRQGLSGQLPDCRAYELVTPVDKGGAVDMFGEELPSPGGGQERVHTLERGDSSEDGNGFLLDTLADFGSFSASSNNSYVFTRGGNGWTTASAAAPTLGAQNLLVNVFSPDLSAVAVEDALSPSLQEGEGQVVQLVGPAGGPYATVYAGEHNSPTEGELVGGSADLSHVVIETRDPGSAPGDAGQQAGRVLYEWVAGRLRLVGLDSGGSLLSRCGASLGPGIGAAGRSAASGLDTGAVSSDGSKIFFTAPDPEVVEGPNFVPPAGSQCSGEGFPPQLYMRLNGASTVEVSAPDPGVVDPDGQQPAIYVGASRDGSEVFFLTKTELTPDAVGLHDLELYEYDTVTSTLTRVSRGDSGSAEGAVSAVPAISSDGSTVYFLAGGALAPGAPVGGGLYRYDTGTGVTTFVTSGASYPPVLGAHHVWWESYAGRIEVGLDQQAQYYTTGNGRFLVFGSTADLTGFDSRGFEELYRYDAADGSIVCVSCDPGGAPPSESALFTRSFNYHDAAVVTPRPISEDGSYVFFDTASTLVPQASRGVIHVYEWHDGTISLIDSPSDPVGSFFLDSSADGSNVFFGTHAQLVPQDTDLSGDVYDARIDGGFEQPAPPACTGTGCQGVPSAPPLFATPASTTFNGVGNFPPPPAAAAGKPKPKAKPVKCKKGSVKRGSKCVKRVKAKAKKPAKGRK
jgi:hypothetical protein